MELNINNRKNNNNKENEKKLIRIYKNRTKFKYLSYECIMIIIFFFIAVSC